jgi:hypothetical protein
MINSDPIIVTLTYDIDPKTNNPTVIVRPAVVKVAGGEAIRFRRLGNLEGKMRITFADRELFHCKGKDFAASGAFHEGDGDVQVKTKPRHGRTTFLCELLAANGDIVARSGEGAGGAIEPMTS